MGLKDAFREAINAYVLAIRIKRCPDHISTVTGAERLERLERLIHVFRPKPRPQGGSQSTAPSFFEISKQKEIFSRGYATINPCRNKSSIITCK